MEIKALACELPKDLGLPFPRFGRRAIAQEVVKRGIVASISRTTVWCRFNADAICPWCYRSCIWPRDPDFERKAALIWDLYHGQWKGKPVGQDDYVVSADEKTIIQARRHVAPTTAPKGERSGRIEHEYERTGSLAYLAARDVRGAKIFGLYCERTGIASFHQLADRVMKGPPHSYDRRVFWVIDNRPSTRAKASVDRIKEWYSNAALIHMGVHASWLNQVEIHFSILKQKILSPNKFENIAESEERTFLSSRFTRKPENHHLEIHLRGIQSALCEDC